MAAAKPAKAAKTAKTAKTATQHAAGLHVAEWVEGTATAPGAWTPVPAPPDIVQWFVAAQTTVLLPGHTVAVLQNTHPAADGPHPEDCAHMPKPFCYALFQGGAGTRRVITLWPTTACPAFNWFQPLTATPVPAPPPAALTDMTPAMWQQLAAAAAAMDTTACVHAVCDDAMWVNTLHKREDAGLGAAAEARAIAAPAAAPVISLEATLNSFSAHGVVPPPAKLLSQLSGAAAVHELSLSSIAGAASRTARGAPPPRHRSSALLKEAHANSGAAAICVPVVQESCGDGADDDDSDGSRSDASRDDDDGDGDGDGNGDEDMTDGACGRGGGAVSGARSGTAAMLAGLVTIREDDDDGDGDGDGDCDADGDGDGDGDGDADGDCDLDGVAAVLDDDDEDDDADGDDDSDGALFGFDNDGDDGDDE
jgi:hypothetical protein